MRIVAALGLIILTLLTVPFAYHGMARTVGAFLGDAQQQGWLFHPGAHGANIAIFAHMTTGGILTVAAPVQVVPVIRRRWPRVHRVCGYVLAVTAVLTALGGLTYIALQGSVGGPWMSGWFALYGVLMLWAAAQTVYFAIDKNIPRHRRWALRLVVLALGSWLYRVAYGLWLATLGRVGIEDGFTGPFDRVMVWAFFILPLAALEIWFWQEHRRRGPGRRLGQAAKP